MQGNGRLQLVKVTIPFVWGLYISRCSYILLVLFLFVVKMDSLPRFGVSEELSHEEFSRRLRCANDLDIAQLRLSLCEDAKESWRWKVCCWKARRRNLVAGVLYQDKNRVPCVLLKNGKCSKVEFEQSQSNSSQAVSCSTSNYLVDQFLTGTTNSLPANSYQCT